METKVMKVYYNEQGLPFKDSALTIPYSIIGSEFTGANNTTEIRFYVENIDNELTWVANIKLQDGTLTYRLLTPVIDEDNKTYQLLEMDNGITSKKGFIYLGLNGYGGETLIEEVNGVLTINGNPTIVATGTISIALNYTPIVIPLGTSVEPTEIQQILSALSIKQDKFNLNNVRGYDTLALATTDLPNLIEWQIIIVKGTPTKIYQVQSGALVDLTVNKATSDSLGNVIKDSYVSAVYPTYNTTTDKLFIETYSVEDVLMANNEVILPKATTTKNGLMAKEDKVKVDGLATTYETIVNSDAKIKELSGYFTTIDSMLTALNGKGTGMYIATYNSLPIIRVLILYYNSSSNSGGAIFIYGGSVKHYVRDTNSVWTLYSTFATQEWANTQLTAKQSTSQKGQPNGYASLDSGGKVPSTQLPSYVDDVLEYANLASFPATGSASVIYVALDTNLTYRWSGSAYVEISPSLALGETAETAYRGDRGKTAYDHSQVVSGNPHNVTKADIGLTTTDVGTYKNLKIDTADVQVQSAVGDKNGNDITTTYALQSDVSDIEAVIPANATALNPLLARSDAVKIIAAPSSTTLTDDQITQFINGVYINGTFLGYVNPVFYPARVTDATYYYGVLCGASETAVAVERVYRIHKTTKVIDSATYTQTVFFSDGRALIQISGLNGATFPATNPSGTEPYDLTIANGVYSFKERIYEYAELYLADNTTTVSLSANTLTKFAIPMTGGASDGITIDTTNVTATIVKTGVYKVEISFGNKASVDNVVLDTWVYKNTTTIIPQLQQRRTARNKEDDNVSTISGIVSLTAGDVLDVRVSASLACNLTVRNVSFSLHRIK